MRFSLRHSFACTPDQLWALTEDPAFEQELAQATSTTRELVEDTTRAGVRVRRIRITAHREIPAVMQKAIGSDRISYEQRTERPTDGQGPLRWSIHPTVLQGRFRAEGVTRVVVTPQGCDRVIEGEIEIRVPLVGSTMEKKLVDDVQASYTRAAEVIRRRLG
jgi:hypothetical protein